MTATDQMPPLAAEGAATAPAAADAAPPARMPDVLMRTTPEWRRACLARVAKLPSGYTYLGQLMGHDVGSSVSLDSVPHVARGNAIGAVSVLGGRRYNLIDNPLTLETIYGPGPLMLSHLYDPDTMLFRLTPGAVLARVYRRGVAGLMDGDSRPIRALYDERNRDTLMLHELAVAWMQFHNLCARRLLAAGMSPFAAYVAVRGHAVKVWHGIIRADILPRFLHPEIAALPRHRAEWQMDENTLLHGLFRAFHALPLAGYNLGRSGRHNLTSLMKGGLDPTEAEMTWRIDWPLFFGARAGGPMTGLSASVAPELRLPAAAAAIIALDQQTAALTNPLRPGQPEIAAALARLPAPWPARLAPAALAADFNAAFPDAPVTVSAEAIEWGPLFQMLLIEAQLHGQRGGLGPFGSALLRGSIEGSMARVRNDGAGPATGQLPAPVRMLDLIQMVGRERI